MGGLREGGWDGREGSSGGLEGKERREEVFLGRFLLFLVGGIYLKPLRG